MLKMPNISQTHPYIDKRLKYTLAMPNNSFKMLEVIIYNMICGKDFRKETIKGGTLESGLGEPWVGEGQSAVFNIE